MSLEKRHVEMREMPSYVGNVVCQETRNVSNEVWVGMKLAQVVDLRDLENKINYTFSLSEVFYSRE